MAVVGEAHIIVRAITTSVEKDIRKGFSGISGAGGEAGDNLGKSFRKALDKQMSASGPGKLADALRGLVPEAERVYLQFRRLTRIGYAAQAGFGAIVGSIGSIVGGLGALIGVAGAAASSLIAVASAGASIGTAFGVAKFAFGGIGEAMQEARGGGGGGGQDNTAAIEAAQRKLAEVIAKNSDKLVDANNKVTVAQEKLNRALREGREELQQISFSAEQAALDEKEAAIELEKARETLQGVQDLPPNSRARREALLAYEQAELNLRLAQDAASDLATEEQRLSRLGVEGTEDVIDARRELAEAEEDRIRVIRDNAFDLADAEADLEEALRKTSAALGAATRAYDKLTASQKVFVGFLKQIKPLFAGLREDVAGGFLPVLQTQIQRFIDAGLVGVLSAGFTEIGVALGETSELFTSAFLNSRGLDNLSSFFTTTARVVPSMGRALGLSFGSFLEVLKAAEPITIRFVEFIEGKAETLQNFLSVKGASGELEAFFTRAGDLGARFGDVFGNIFGFLGDIIMANFGPGSGGDMVLSWLQKVTQGFNDIDPTFLESYFKGASENAIALLDSFGILFELLIRAGDDPGVKGFYDNLNQGASALAIIIRESVAAAPSLGRFLALATEIIAIFADSGSVKAFFDTLNIGLGALLNFLEAIKPAIDFVGPIFATITAITLMGSLLLTVGKVFAGFGITALTSLARIPATATLGINGLTGLSGASTRAAAALATVGPAATVTAAQTTAAAKLTAAGWTVVPPAIAKSTAALATVGPAATVTAAQTTAAAKLTAAGWTVVPPAAGAAATASTVAGTAIKAAFGPIGIAIGLVTAAFALLAYQSGKTQEAIDNASVATTNAMKSGADGTEIFNSALAAVGDTATRDVLAGTKNLAGSIDGLISSQENATTVMTRYGRATIGPNKISEGYKNTLEAVGNSLGNLATTNLPEAQRSFSSLVKAQKISNDGALEMLATNDGMRQSFIDQANQMGINILGINGMVDEQLLLNFALGQGEVAVRAAADAERSRLEGIRRVNQGLSEAAQRAVGFGDATSIALKNGEVNFEQTVKNLNDKAFASTQFFNNLLTLQQKGISESAINFLKTAGDQGVLLAQDLVGRTSAELLKFNAPFKTLELQSGPTFTRISDSITKALNGGKIGTETAARLQAQLSSATTAADMQRIGGQLAREIEKSVSAKDPWKRTSAAVTAGVDGAATGKGIADAVTGALGSVKTMNDAKNAGNGIRNSLQSSFSTPISVTIQVKTKYLKATGGIVEAAVGGLIRGPGTGTSDSIPAMLSDGEYVINAKATSMFRPILDAINYGKSIPASPPTGAVNTKQGSTSSPQNINITVNPSAGMNERELAKLVSREIAYSMRKGAMS